MRLCTKCNRMLRSSETYCRYCAGEISTDISDPQDRPDASTDAQAVTLEIPIAGKSAEHAPFVLRERPEPPRARQDEPHGATVEIPLESLDQMEETDSFGALDFEAEENLPGYIEQQIEDLEDDDERESTGLGKLGVTLLALLIIAVLFFGYKLYTRLRQTPDTISSEAMSALIEGQWISERFSYSDDESQQYVELLEFRDDGTFQFQYLIPNRSIPDGYLTGDWEIAENRNGTYESFPSLNTILMIYDDNGTSINYTREIISITDKTMVLREYYNEARTDYFEISFTRV